MAIKQLDPAAVQYLAVHCSATPPSMDIGVNEIDRWHRAKGFLKVGYHFVVRRDGTVEFGRSPLEVGAHIEGFNSESIGICLVGGVDGSKQQKPEDNFTTDQKESLKLLLQALKATYPGAVIQGHRDFPGVSKACPSFDVRAWAEAEGL